MRRRSAIRRLLVLAAALVIIIAVANVRTSSLRGVNYVVTTESLPLYAKAVDFIDRDINYRRLAAAITEGRATDEQKLRAMFDWTRANIRDVPEGFPVIDDHVWYVIVRGYGADDQKADVFTTLLTYAGVPAYWIFIGPKPELALSLARIDGTWRVSDVQNGIIFKTPDGRMATVEELAARADVFLLQGPETFRTLRYADYFAGFRAPLPPDLMRADLQMLGRRTWREMKRLAGRSDREWDIRPPSRVAAP